MDKLQEKMISGDVEKQNKNERIKKLEKENEALRWALKKVKDALKD